ncbi:MAG: hypothetical protein AB2A00_23770 [Myxococcota bacterium]
MSSVMQGVRGAVVGARRVWRGLSWRRMERALLVLFLVAKALALYRRWGVQMGHDAFFQMEVTRMLGWKKLTLGLRDCFNCYQPPLGYLIPKLFALLGFNEVLSAQLASFTSSLVAFLLLRGAVQRMGLLRRPEGIVFLYVSSSIPIQLYLTTSITLDSFMYAWACAILYTSVVAFWRWGAPQRGRRVAMVALVLLLASSTLVKYSGFILFSIPVFVALLQARVRRGSMRSGGRWLAPSVRAVILGVTATALVMPYYYQRYYTQTGKLFPIASDWLRAEDVRKGRTMRDQHTAMFVRALLTPPDHADEHPDWADQKVCRLHDAWRHFWIRFHVTGWGGPTAFQLSKLYLAWMPWLLLAGAVYFVRRIRRRDAWNALGILVVLVGGLHVAGLIRHIWDNPFAEYIPAKAYYISPVCWMLGYLMANLTRARGLAPMILAVNWRNGRKVLVAVAGVFMFANHWVTIF